MEIHSFRVDIATKYGIAEAILLGYFYHWITIAEKNESNFHDGRYWTYDTERSLTMKMPYIPKSTMHRLIIKLVKAGLLLTGNYNKMGYDKTTWFSLSESGKSLFEQEKTCPEMGQRYLYIRKKKKWTCPEMGQPCPKWGNDTYSIYLFNLPIH